MRDPPTLKGMRLMRIVKRMGQGQAARHSFLIGLVALGVSAFAPGCSDSGGDSGDTCPIASEGCSCTSGQTCDEGLTCYSNVCVRDTAGTGGAAGSGSGIGGTTTSDNPCEGMAEAACRECCQAMPDSIGASFNPCTCLVLGGGSEDPCASNTDPTACSNCCQDNGGSGVAFVSGGVCMCL
jgi:hypothetical protein